MKILLTGGSGMLGSEIRKLDTKLIAPSETELDITKPNTIDKAIAEYNPDCILHLAAATRPPDHEVHPENGISVNIIGTANMAIACLQNAVRLVYTCTDYNYFGEGPHSEEEPQKPHYNFGWSKLGGEASVAVIPNSLILRLSFGPVPYPWDKVYKDQWNSKLYVDEMAPLVLKAAQSSAVGILNLGGPRTTLEAYARRSLPDIDTIEKPEWVPADTSLDISKMKQLFKIDNEQELLKR